MKRFGRWMFNGLTVLSLLLCLGMAGLWVLSYWVVDAIIRDDLDAGKAQYVASKSGVVTFGAMLFGQDATLGLPEVPGVNYSSGDPAWSYVLDPPNSLGFGWKRSVAPPPYYHSYIYLPHSFLISIFAILPSFFAFRCPSHRRKPIEGHCPHCGYDLRATPERCPECGTISAKRTA